MQNFIVNVMAWIFGMLLLVGHFFFTWIINSILDVMKLPTIGPRFNLDDQGFLMFEGLVSGLLVFRKTIEDALTIIPQFGVNFLVVIPINAIFDYFQGKEVFNTKLIGLWEIWDGTDQIPLPDLMPDLKFVVPGLRDILGLPDKSDHLVLQIGVTLFDLDLNLWSFLSGLYELFFEALGFSADDTLYNAGVLFFFEVLALYGLVF